MTAVAAALLLAAAAWLWVGPTAALDVGGSSRRAMPRWLLAVLVAVSVVVAGGALAGTSGALWVLDGCVVGGTVAHLAAASAARRRAARRADEIAHAMQVVAGQMRVGSVPSAALVSAAKDCPCLERPAATQAIGGDVARALAEAGNAPGREGLQAMARAWELAERTGAPMASLAMQASERVRRDHETRRVVQAELAGPRATGRLLAFLPVVGILMGGMAGTDPVGFLTTTIPGQLCLLAGLVLACVGVLWTEQMARHAQEA